MIEFLAGYWWLILVAIAAIIVIVYYCYKFYNKPTSEQIAKVKEWLLYAVTQAEKELGGGTGEIKLRYVYDMFITKFPFLVPIISFEFFSAMVDEVLEQFKEILAKNNKIEAYVENIK